MEKKILYQVYRLDRFNYERNYTFATTSLLAFDSLEEAKKYIDIYSAGMKDAYYTIKKLTIETSDVLYSKSIFKERT